MVVTPGITHPEDTEYLLKNCLHKDAVMQLLKPVLGDGAFIAPVPEWSRRRKVLIPAFSPKVLNGFVDIISKRSQEIVNQLSSENLVGCGQFSIWPYISQHTLRTVTGLDPQCQLRSFLDHLIIISGNEGGFSMKDIREDLLLLLFAGTDTSAVAICNTLKLLAKYPKIQEKVYAELEEVFGDSDRLLVKDDLKNVKYLDRVLKESLRLFPPAPIIAEKQEDLEKQDSNNKNLNCIATDSSAVAICNTLQLLAKYPKVQEKVYDEIKKAVGDSDRVLNKDDLQNITYLGAVLKESLRLFPPVPIVARKTQNEVKLPSGVILPSNIGVLISIWGINRDPETWGPDADCFVPERHLIETENAPTMIPFSSGPRNCVGYHYALMSVKISLIAILRRFRIVGEEETGPAPTMECDFTLLMKAKDGYSIALENR
ncbi:cytochrome P450 4C1-like [Zerene cesonia]|uniref:cytochrome P450 4C1-like n=1 Tax=Zerene cesonia TaxID=33412 RepID=UPI0018E505A7|nr:cytochrome P450 4C1-like [Zerene cesonia]